MRHLQLIFAGVTLALLSACYTTTDPGRCNRTSECALGMICNLDPTPQGNGRCVVPSTDAGADLGADAGDSDVDDGGATEAGDTRAGEGGTDLGGGCADDSHCTDITAPFCNTALGICVAQCSSDFQCAAKFGADPGICLTNQGGRCATDADVVYVQHSAACLDSGAGAGTAATPFCTPAPATGQLVSNSKTVLVVRGTVQGTAWAFQQPQGSPALSIIGQQSAFVASAVDPAITLRSGSLYVRAVKLSSLVDVGIRALGGTLELDHVVVDSCMGGGILLDGAAFNIRNTTVTRNGPGQLGVATWGGVLVNSLPAAGPRQIHLATVSNNNQIGLTCAAAIDGAGVAATTNVGGDISSTCGFAPCSPSGLTCGAQP